MHHTSLTRNRRGLTSRFAAAATRPSRPLIYPFAIPISIHSSYSSLQPRAVGFWICRSDRHSHALLTQTKPTFSGVFGSQTATPGNLNGWRGNALLPLAGSPSTHPLVLWSGGLPAWPIVWPLPLVTWIGVAPGCLHSAALTWIHMDLPLPARSRNTTSIPLVASLVRDATPNAATPFLD